MHVTTLGAIKHILLCTVVALLNAVEGTRTLSIVARDVSVQGRLDVSGESHIEGIGHGIVQVRDQRAKATLLLGTSKAAGSGKVMRMIGVEGQGVGITSSSETGGLFVSADSGSVGVNTCSKVSAALHVDGGIRAQKVVAGQQGPGAALVLRRAETYHSVVLGQPKVDSAQSYSLGRARLSERTMSFHVPSTVEYGSGQSPQAVYQSTSQTLASFTADSGNAFISGTVSLSGPQKQSSSGSNLDIHGAVSLSSLSRGSARDSSWFFPFARGSNPSFSIRSNSPEKAEALDTKFFITSGKTGTSRVGINTLRPKAKLHIEGHLLLSSKESGRGDAVVYYPLSGGQAGFSLRSSDDPKENDRSSTRFFVSPDGRVGLNTVQPESGLEIHPKEGTESSGDMLIKRGSMRVHGGLRDLDKLHFLEFNGENFVHAVSVEQSISVGVEKSSNVTANQLHLQGSGAPKLLIENSAEGSSAIAFQSGKGAWNLESAGNNVLQFKQTHGGKISPVVLDGAGGLHASQVGSTPKASAVYIEVAAEFGAPENSLAVSKGGVALHGAISKRELVNNKQVLWSLHPHGLSHLKVLNVEETLSIGMKEHEENLAMGQHHAASLGETAFLYSTGDIGSISYNEYSAQRKEIEHKLHYPDDFGAAMRVSNTGQIQFEGTAGPGRLQMNSLFVVDAASHSVNFGKLAQFGFREGQQTQTPLTAIGVGDQGSTLAFGASVQNRGHLGSNDKVVSFSTHDHQGFLSVSHHSGNVGIGTNDAQDKLTVLSNQPNTVIMLSSQSACTAVTLSAAGSLQLSAPASTKQAGRLFLQDFSSIEFVSGTDQQGGTTVFDRVATTAEISVVGSGTNFVSGNVGIGLVHPEKLLHVNGDTWWQGKMVITKGFAHDELEEESLLELGESGFDDDPQTDLGSMLESMAKVIRDNNARLAKQHRSITQMESVLALMQRST